MTHDQMSWNQVPWNQSRFPDVTSDGYGAWKRGIHAIYAESADFVRRSLERQAETVEKCLQADSLEAAFDIQLTCMKLSFDDYCEHVGRVSQLTLGIGILSRN
ncbi:MAG: phasin family protein [Pseudomonadota bacterium]